MIERLHQKMRDKGNPVCVGLDPQISHIPDRLLDDAVRQYGRTLKAAAEAVWVFNRMLIDAIYDLVPVVKPQIAMYERLGITGVEVFGRTVDYARRKGLLVIGDAKRGDIGSTSAAYADAHLGRISFMGESLRAFDEDFLTVNPYLGTDGVKPFVDVCCREDKGIFVLVKTSNPSSGEFQDRLIDGRPLYEHVAEKVNEWGAGTGEGGYSDVGAVVGATYPEAAQKLREMMPRACLLVPGYGAQGGKAGDLVPYFDRNGFGAIVNSSRGIIAAWQQERYASLGQDRFDEAARQAVIDMIADIGTYIRQKPQEEQIK